MYCGQPPFPIRPTGPASDFITGYHGGVLQPLPRSQGPCGEVEKDVRVDADSEQGG